LNHSTSYKEAKSLLSKLLEFPAAVKPSILFLKEEKDFIIIANLN
jgi:hypothetical protein